MTTVVERALRVIAGFPGWVPRGTNAEGVVLQRNERVRTVDFDGVTLRESTDKDYVKLNKQAREHGTKKCNRVNCKFC